MSPLEPQAPFPTPPSPLDEVWPRHARGSGAALVVTLFDLTPLLLESLYLEADPTFVAAYRARLELIRAADRILTLTEATAAEAVSRLRLDDDRVTVIGLGGSANPGGSIGSAAAAWQYLGLVFPLVRPGFLVCVSEEGPGDGLEQLIDAYCRLPQSLRGEHQLLVLCEMSRARRSDLFTRATKAGVSRDELLVLDRFDDPMVSAALRACALFVLPALYDGAGLSITEAMSCGAPVVAGRRGCAPEVLGGLSGTFDPSDTTAIANCLHHVLAEPDELAALRERSVARTNLLGWDRVAKRTLEAYKRVARRETSWRGRGRRSRLALLTPWPPQRSGVANHSRQLTAALAKYADIDVIVAAPNGVGADQRSLDPRVKVHADAEYDWMRELRDYDSVLYVLGNSRYHVHVLRLLIEKPGHVLLHDVRLTGLYDATSYRSSREPDWLTAKLVEMYGDRIPLRELRAVPDLAIEERYGIFMTQEVQQHADTILTHSRHAVELLHLECVPGMTPPPAEVVSHGVTEPPVRAEPGRSEGPLIVSYGAVAMVKGIDVMLQAFGRIADDRPGARLVLVGPATPDDARYVRRLGSEIGIVGKVELRGHVEPSEYWRVLGSADLAIQLRMWSNGEASGAVVDCLAARVPTIVSDLGWFSELPDRVVLPVPRDSSPDRISALITEVLDDPSLRGEIRAAQDEYVAANSYSEVAKRYSEILRL